MWATFTRSTLVCNNVCFSAKLIMNFKVPGSNNNSKDKRSFQINIIWSWEWCLFYLKGMSLYEWEWIQWSLLFYIRTSFVSDDFKKALEMPASLCVCVYMYKHTHTYPLFVINSCKVQNFVIKETIDEKIFFLL